MGYPASIYFFFNRGGGFALAKASDRSGLSLLIGETLSLFYEHVSDDNYVIFVLCGVCRVFSN